MRWRAMKKEEYIMPDYKSMYYHLAGRMATAVDALDATTKALEANASAFVEIKERLKLAQQITEDMFINGDEGVGE